mgnify:CR=1 FL=1
MYGNKTIALINIIFPKIFLGIDLFTDVRSYTNLYQHIKNRADINHRSLFNIPIQAKNADTILGGRGNQPLTCWTNMPIVCFFP